jgi:vacuolar-type H+-ATPase subunit I/STV1
MCYSNHKTKLCKSENYPLDVFKEILAKQIKILKSNIPSFKELLINEFSKVKEEPISNEIESLNSQIESLRNKYNDIKDYHDDYFISLQEETMNQINQLVAQRSILQNKENSVDVNTRVKQIIDNLKALPDDFDDVETINFKSVFSKAVIVNKGLIYFMVGNEDIKNLPLRPDLYFKSSTEYRVRKSIFTTQFGIMINN